MKQPKPFPEPIYVTRPLFPPLERFQERLAEVWKSQWLTNNGAQHRELESHLREYLKVRALSLFNNGTTALMVAVRALRLSGEVVTTPFTFPATPHVLSWHGIRPVFCDINPETLNLDPEKIEAVITPQTTGILGVHVYGAPCNVEAIAEVADRFRLRVIYDAAHAFGVEIDGRGIGEFGDATMFSFHATKLFHTAEGGALAFPDQKLKNRVDLLRNFGIRNEEEVVMPGINGKMNEIQAALGISLLEVIELEREARRRIVHTYRRLLADVPGIRLPEVRPGTRESYQYFVIRIDARAFGRSRDAVQALLKQYNIMTRKYFYPLCSNYSCYRQIPTAAPDRLPMAHSAVREVLCLPLYGQLSETDAERIADAIKFTRQ